VYVCLRPPPGQAGRHGERQKPDGVRQKMKKKNMIQPLRLELVNQGKRLFLVSTIFSMIF
jgi:hypothetical protein